jgi:hypothetical protein
MSSMMATWLRRMLKRRAEPVLPPPVETTHRDDRPRTNDTMTTSDGTRILLRARRLVVPGVEDPAAEPPGSR